MYRKRQHIRSLCRVYLALNVVSKMLDEKRNLRRKIIKKLLLGSSVLPLSGAFSAVSGSQSKLVTVDTLYHSLKFPEKTFTSVVEFWANHPSFNSHKLDCCEKPSLIFLKKRIFSKICGETGLVTTRVQYESMSTYMSHVEFLKQKYNLKVSRKGDSKIIISSNEIIAVDKIS